MKAIAFLMAVCVGVIVVCNLSHASKAQSAIGSVADQVAKNLDTPLLWLEWYRDYSDEKTFAEYLRVKSAYSECRQ